MFTHQNQDAMSFFRRLFGGGNGSDKDAGKGPDTKMTYIKDIKEKIESDYGEKASDVFYIFDEAILKTHYLNHNRIIRCILFLAEKNIDKLKKNIQAAEDDPRDVMYWAEYINREQEPKRIRDFNKTFDESETDVKE